jgi:hypothetical protein
MSNGQVVHCKDAAAVNVAGDRYVYVGRPTKWGNPYSHKHGTAAKYHVDSREEAVKKFEEHLLSNEELIADLSELKGKVLGCWCHPLDCHADILWRYANGSSD